MSQSQWTAVDQYLNDLFVPEDPVLEAVVQAMRAGGLPEIHVSPSQGKLLNILARSVGARSILEIGSLGGYSAIWLGRALPPDGKMTTLEASPRHAEVARANLARAGLSGIVEVQVGPGLDTLPRLEAEGRGPFDLVFIDADKENTPEYFQWAVKLTRPGSLIITDNVVRGGDVADLAVRDAGIQAIRRFNDIMAAEPRVSATAFQTVGSKGYDGFAIALVT